DQGGEENGGGHGEGEFGKEAAEVAFEKSDRGEDRDEDHSGGYHREADLTGAVVGGNQRRFSGFDAAGDVFEDHDGIVHHQPDSEDEGEEGKQVDGEAHKQKHRERGNQSDGNRDCGDE